MAFYHLQALGIFLLKSIDSPCLQIYTDISEEWNLPIFWPRTGIISESF